MRGFSACLTLLASLLFSSTIYAEADEAAGGEAMRSLTEAYVATLDSDLALQATFYTPTTRFTDPTSALFGPAWDITGGEQIIEFLRTASEDSGTLSVDYNITNMLVEGPFVVANIIATVTACGVGLGFPTKSFTGDIRMVMVLEFDGDKIKQRTDYAGYSAAWEFMDAIKPALGTQEDDPRCSQ